MLISRKRHNHMKETIARQADSIKVLALQREKSEREIELSLIEAENMRSEIKELKLRLAAAEGRNDALRKAVEGMQQRMIAAIKEAAELRAINSYSSSSNCGIAV